jgi:membrane associated rhomboid family serine protease
MQNLQRRWPIAYRLYSATPVTILIIIIWALVFLLSHFGVRQVDFLVFQPGKGFTGWIGAVTYSLLISNPISLLFNGLILFQFGGSLERSWSWKTYLAFLLAVNTVALIVWQLGCILLIPGYNFIQPFATPWFMISAIVVAWAWINQLESISFWFIPLNAKLLGWIDIALTYFFFSTAFPPILPRLVGGIFALGGIAVALLWVKYRIRVGNVLPHRYSQPQRQATKMQENTGGLLSIYREWQRKQRIKQLRKKFRM